jgi:hypothetical protein
MSLPTNKYHILHLTFCKYKNILALSFSFSSPPKSTPLTSYCKNDYISHLILILKHYFVKLNNHMWKESDFYGVIAQAHDMVPGFKAGYRNFEQQVVLRGLSNGLLTNYGRNVAHVALHFGRCPESISVEEINCYLYRKAVEEKVCESYLKHTVFGLRMWLRMYGKDEEAIRIPAMKSSHKLPEVLSKVECKELFRAPKSFKHRFLLAFTYSTGMRLRELRFVKLSDIDSDRMRVRIRQRFLYPIPCFGLSQTCIECA